VGIRASPKHLPAPFPSPPFGHGDGGREKEEKEEKEVMNMTATQHPTAAILDSTCASPCRRLLIFFLSLCRRFVNRYSHRGFKYIFWCTSLLVYSFHHFYFSSLTFENKNCTFFFSSFVFFPRLSLLSLFRQVEKKTTNKTWKKILFLSFFGQKKEERHLPTFCLLFSIRKYERE